MSKDLNNYRLDIDGVRAIAVISVILYHLEFTYGENVLFTGGFTGVDIFFCYFRLFNNKPSLQRIYPKKKHKYQKSFLSEGQEDCCQCCFFINYYLCIFLFFYFTFFLE